MLSKNEFMPVAIRCRPLSPAEMLKSGTRTPIEIDCSKKELTITHPTLDPNDCKPKTFQFDIIFDSTTSQESVYKEIGFPVVDTYLSGTDGAIFTYGQTGAGKTYTMEGILESEEHKGIIPRVFEHIFKEIKGSPEKYHSVQVSNLLIYSEKIRDLLSESPQKDLKIRERKDIGVYIEGMKLIHVKSLEEMYEQFELGRKNKKLAFTTPNENFCCSTSIFSIILESYEEGQDGEKQVRSRKLDLVDMVSSGRPSIHLEHRELINISRSLSVFCQVIFSLANTKTRPPYRDSALTRILQNTFGGSAMFALIGNISPSVEDYDESLCTLRLWSRAKHIKRNSSAGITKHPVLPSPLETFMTEFEELKARMQKLYTTEMLEKVPFEKIKQVIAEAMESEKELAAKSETEEIKPN